MEVSFNTKLKICDSIIICLDQRLSSSCCLLHHDSFHVLPPLHLQFRYKQQHTWPAEIAWLPAKCHSPHKVNKKAQYLIFSCPAVSISHVRRTCKAVGMAICSACTVLMLGRAELLRFFRDIWNWWLSIKKIIIIKCSSIEKIKLE